MDKSSSVMERNNSFETFWPMMIHFLKICFLLLLKESRGQQEVFSFPEKLEALQGSCVEIPCIFSYPTHHVRWYVYDEDKHHVIVSSDNTTSILSHYKHRTSLVQSTKHSCTLRIDNVNAEDGKHYYPGVDNVTAYYINRRMVKIDVIDPPKNTTAVILGDSNIQEGDDVTLLCISKANPDIHSYQWSKGVEIVRSAGEGQNITLKHVRWSIEPYFCTAKNKKGQGQSAFLIIPVKYAAKGVQIIKYENRDGTTELRCQVSSSNPDVTHFTWLRDNFPLITQNSPTLWLNNSEINSGEYDCVAHNLIGNASSEVKVFVGMKETPNGTDAGSSPMYGLIALLPILLILFFILRRYKIKWCPSNQGRNSEETQVSEPIYLEIKENKPFKEYSDIKVTPTSKTFKKQPLVAMGYGEMCPVLVNEQLCIVVLGNQTVLV
ncbi:hypothetical protein XELAEV_18004282mg [Xenopus laevis]|uniref:Ig-like domain-containing protein n=1 Tax=Xenopus laevis TaxID=8355 RepID=A0A974GZT3_XENLA|nr:hypothetical protein XELAEV_18004282mg [Xenopus laevis]